MVCTSSDVITSDICVVVVETSKTTTIEVFENDLTVNNLNFPWVRLAGFVKSDKDFYRHITKFDRKATKPDFMANAFDHLFLLERGMIPVI